MPVSALKTAIIDNILKTDDNELLFEIKALLESDPKTDKNYPPLLGEVDWDELESQINDLQEPEFTWDELNSKVQKSRR